MRKISLVTLILLIFSAAVFGQKNGSVTATLLDQQTHEAILGAVVEYASAKAPAMKKHTTSGALGKIAIGSLPYGQYTMKITYLGYADLQKTFAVNAPRVNLDTIYIKQKLTRIDGVVMEIQSMRTTQKGDTLVYNAGAFKVTKDADTEGLLSKMPGVTITDSGVEAQGETVKKIFVDGKEFFGNDVSSAIKNLPAEAVDKVEVYNKLSDQAEFTGVDDGEGYKAINIVTKLDMRKGQFGKIYGGYGYDDKYIGGGNVNVFNGESRWSFIGLVNNINKQNFSTEDILGVTGASGGGMRSHGGSMRHGGGVGNFMVGQQGGISKVASFGVNYSDKWGKKVDFSGSYFFNTNKNNNLSLSDRRYYSSTDTTRVYNSVSNSNSRNYNHRLNAKIDYRINENNSLMIRPSLSFQNYKTGNKLDGENNNLIGSVSELINSLNNKNSSKSNGYNISNSILYRMKFGTLGRSLTFEANGQVNKNDRTSDQFAQTITSKPQANTTIQQQYILNNSSGYRVDGSATYTEPLSKASQLILQYRISYNYSDADKKSYRDILYTDIDNDLSNVYNSGYLRHRVGPGYRLFNEKVMLVANVNYQRSTLEGEREYPTNMTSPKYAFDNIVYFGMLNYTFNPTNKLRMFLRSATSNPSVTQLQDVVDVSNPQFVSSGNPDLKPAYSHNLFANYIKSSVVKGKTFMATFSLSKQSNYIADATTIYGLNAPIISGVQLQPNAQYTKPVNMNGYWNTSVGVSYGVPIKFIKTNINMNLGGAYTEAPSIINGKKNISSGQYYNAGVVLGSNISENVDFTLRYNGSYNLVKNSIQTRSNNKSFMQSATGDIKLVMWAGFTFTGNVSYTNYHGISDNFNEQYLICNAFLGKKFLKNQRAEVKVGVNDILDQNRSFSHRVTDTYLENVTNNAIGRYVGVQFVYNLRNFGKRSKSRDSYDSSARPPMGTMGGPGGMHF